MFGDEATTVRDLQMYLPNAVTNLHGIPASISIATSFILLHSEHQAPSPTAAAASVDTAERA